MQRFLSRTRISLFPGLIGLFFLCLTVATSRASDQADFVRDGVAGFVVSNIQYALSTDASETGACPQGMNESYRDPREAYVNLPKVQHHSDAAYEELEDRVEKIALTNPNVKSLCLHPELGLPNTVFKPVTGEDAPVLGVDLDGRVSTSEKSAGHESCPHNDFMGMAGETGIDNQYFRVVGCTKGYQPTGLANSFNIAQLTGAWGMLIKISDVDNIRNDNQVEVGIYANGDPIQLSSQREPLPYATYTVHQESRFHASTQGRIVDGVLRTDPVEVRIPYDINAMYVDRVLRDAQLQVRFEEDGRLEGYLAGYAPIEEQYDLEFGFRDARKSTSESSELGPFRLRMISGIGKAGALGYTCEGIYHALYTHADGHPDPKSGKCTSISTQYQIQAIPAFIVERLPESEDK